MAYQWYDPNQHQQGGLAAPGSNFVPTYGANGQIVYQRSAPNSPFGAPVLLPGQPSPAAQPVFLPQVPAVAGYSPGNVGVQLPSPNRIPGQLSSPVLLDVLSPGNGPSWGGRSSNTPHIHYDLRDYPSRALVTTHPQLSLLSQGHLKACITNPALAGIKIISKNFPWEIDVESERQGAPITVEDVINTLHETLDKHIASSEWWIVTDDVRNRVAKQYERNCDAASSGSSRHRGDRGEVEKPRHKSEGVRRVDWLLDNFIMRGLEKDDAFIQKRIPDKSMRENTWCLVVGSK